MFALPRLARRLAASVLVAGSLAAPALPVLAQSDEPILLTVLNDEGTVLAEFTLEDLEALPVAEIDTSTNWTDGMQEFTGVPLSALVEAVAPDAKALDLTAINDYAVTIPRDGWNADYPILAYRNHGETMSVREKGPLWIVYPYDVSAAYRTDVIHSRSVWQLDRLRVID
ncbi:MAG: oxidoreductase [Rhodobacteraceae bacterium]|nr:oxidoreductase [Paracoccaceae bacterium]MBR9820564.1 oxidoreductase [Paracoccaceae bacterium]